ncbi:hypothetical protein [Pseudomonas sp. MAG002Y]|uniref:hypothetical protein n=1 Tax=Pseudomonas sp. MAG002Y TaxID=2678690 RepID=UPI001C60A20D|nr:hypothetical protein [Pseudomonas sp. MAG002Y]MBW5415296.1 hypothetical protein [Pseudomonas sp. MAG002Y]
MKELGFIHKDSVASETFQEETDSLDISMIDLGAHEAKKSNKQHINYLDIPMISYRLPEPEEPSKEPSSWSRLKRMLGYRT